MTEEELLILVRGYCAAHPESAVHIVSAANSGLQEGLAKAYERAGDMEVALTCALDPKIIKDPTRLIKEKLKKWRGKSAIVWDWYIGAKS